jgi:hypothetical protein
MATMTASKPAVKSLNVSIFVDESLPADMDSVLDLCVERAEAAGHVIVNDEDAFEMAVFFTTPANVKEHTYYFRRMMEAGIQFCVVPCVEGLLPLMTSNGAWLRVGNADWKQYAFQWTQHQEQAEANDDGATFPMPYEARSFVQTTEALQLIADGIAFPNDWTPPQNGYVGVTFPKGTQLQHLPLRYVDWMESGYVNPKQAWMSALAFKAPSVEERIEWGVGEMQIYGQLQQARSRYLRRIQKELDSLVELPTFNPFGVGATVVDDAERLHQQEHAARRFATHGQPVWIGADRGIDEDPTPAEWVTICNKADSTGEIRWFAEHSYDAGRVEDEARDWMPPKKLSSFRPHQQLKEAWTRVLRLCQKLDGTRHDADAAQLADLRGHFREMVKDIQSTDWKFALREWSESERRMKDISGEEQRDQLLALLKESGEQLKFRMDETDEVADALACIEEIADAWSRPSVRFAIKALSSKARRIFKLRYILRKKLTTVRKVAKIRKGKTADICKKVLRLFCRHLLRRTCK